MTRPSDEGRLRYLSVPSWSPSIHLLTWRVSWLSAILSQTFIYDTVFYETRSAPSSLVLFSNLNLILLVLNEKY